MGEIYLLNQFIKSELKKRYVFALSTLMILASSIALRAQTTISTNLTANNSAGSGYGITFVVSNTTASDILLTDVGDYLSTADNGATFSLYYSATSLSGTPPLNFPATSWNFIASNTVTGITSSGIDEVISGMTFLIPSNTMYRFSLVTTGTRDYTTSSPNTYSAAGVNLHIGNYQINGMNVGYGASNNPRSFAGSITFMPAAPCVAPPTAGTATISNATPCPNTSVLLGLSGNSFGLTQTYIWQSAPSATGPWTNISTSSPTSALTVTPATPTFYRAQVTCNNQSSFSTPVQANVPPLFPAGTYTINKNAPATATNFQSFGDAISMMSCGIGGPVILNVVTGSGPYNEQVKIGEIPGLNSVNTITINGNGQWLNHGSTNSNVRSPLLLDGADFITVNNLKIKAMGGTYGYGIHLTNGADHNTFSNCEILVDTNSTSSNYVGIAISGSYTSPTTSGSDCDSNTFENNIIHGGYYAYTLLGTTGAGMVSGNKFIGNYFRNFYYYGGYNLYARNTELIENEWERPSRTSTTTTYGLYLGSYTEGYKIFRNSLHDFHTNYSASSSASLYCFYTSSADGIASNPNVFANNIVYNMNSRGTVRYIYELSSTYTHWVYNTFVHEASSSSSAFYGAYISGTSAGRKILNNNWYIDRPGSSSTYGIYKATSSAILDIDHNNIFFATGTTGKYGYAGGDHATLANWQSATPHGQNSVMIDPEFTDVANGDLTPVSYPFDNKGTPITGITDDINLKVRHLSVPDIGAVEYNPCRNPDSLMEFNVGTDIATIQWNSPAISQGSEYVVSNSPNPPMGAGTPTTNNTINLSNLTPGTLYFYHVRNQCMSPYTSEWVTDSFWTMPCTLADPVITNAGGTTICEGNVTELSIPVVLGATYNWYKNDTAIIGANTNVWMPFETGSYHVEMELGGCIVASDSMVITVQAAPDYSYTTNDIDICEGSSTTLTVTTNNNYTYQWRRNGVNIPGATGQSYTATQAGAYRVLVSTSNCTDTSMIRNVAEYPLPMPVIDDSNVPVLSTAAGFISYQWYRYGVPIANSNSNTLNTTQNGYYTVSVVDENGCQNTAEGVQIGPSGINNVTAANEIISVYPNPTNGILHIKVPAGIQYVLQSVDGKVINTPKGQSTIDMSDLAEGVYFIRFVDAQHQLIKVERVVKTAR